MISRRLVVQGLLATSVALICSDVSARRGFTFRGRGIGRGSNYSGPVMTRGELRSCVIQEEHLKGLEKEISAHEQAISQSQTQLEQIEAELKTAERYVNLRSQDSVDRFNRLVDEHGVLVDQHNAKLPLVNEKIETHSQAVNVFNKACAEKAYYEDDLMQIEAERR
mgnify:CR=1 FL=1